MPDSLDKLVRNLDWKPLQVWRTVVDPPKGVRAVWVVRLLLDNTVVWTSIFNSEESAKNGEQNILASTATDPEWVDSIKRHAGIYA